MSNDKVAAAFSGEDPAQVRMEDLAEERAQRLLFIELTTCCWMGKHSSGADHVRMCKNYRETTGEHIQEKLADPQYGMISTADAAESAKVFMQHIADTYGEPEHLKQARDARFQAEYSNQYLRDMAPEPSDLAPAPQRGFFPLTTGEIQMGVVIVIAIIICFILYAAVFRW